MEPLEDSNGSRQGSPQSDDSSSESDLTSPSFNRDIDFATHTDDAVEALPCRNNILDMAPLGTSYENRPDTTVTTTAISSPPFDVLDNTEKKSRILPKPVR